MRKILVLFVVLFSNLLFAQENDGDIEIDLPADFFNGMFRAPSDKNLVAWHGGLTIVGAETDNGEKVFFGDVQPFVGMLNKGFNDIFSKYFQYNMKDGRNQIVSKNGKTWFAMCGLKSTNSFNISPVTGKEITGYTADITNDVWAKQFSFKKSRTNSINNEIQLITIFVQATSIYYSHEEPKDLSGKIKRDDGYQLCGKVILQRIGPGDGDIIENADVEEEKFEFKEQLFRGDYYVNYQFPVSSDVIRLEDDYVYNPSGKNPDPDYTIEASLGEVTGKVKFKETDEYAKDYPVELVPYCSDSGLPEFEVNTDQDGKYEFKDVPLGEYKVVVNGAPDEDAFYTNPSITETTPEDSEISTKYDIIATYTAPGFAKAKLLWANTTIRFPEKGKPVQKFDMVAFKNSGDYENPTGTDGEPLKIPYSTVIPGIGKQTLYGWPENESAIPEVIFVASLGGHKVFNKFKVNLSEDALNTCNISQDNNGPIYLDLNFDLTGKYPKSDVWQQVDVGCKEDKEWNITKGNSLNGYPLAFKQLKFTDVDIDKFKKAEDFEKILSNGKATLKIEFKIVENE